MIDFSPIRTFLPDIKAFAGIQFDAGALRERIAALGWNIDSDMSEYTRVPGGLCLTTRLTDDVRFLLLVGDERTAVVSVAALAPSEACDNNFQVVSEAEFHARFDALLSILVETWGEPTASGSYASQILANARYALWRGRTSWLALMEHDEGDGNCGHIATVDIRILPQLDPPTFPLQTNVLF